MSGKRGSNPRPPAWKASALSTELFPQKKNAKALLLCFSRFFKGEFHKNKRFRNPNLIEWVVMDSNHRSRKTTDLQSAPFGHSGNHPCFCFRRPRFCIGGASCRIRTNDPEITNHVLWPTELKRQNPCSRQASHFRTCRKTAAKIRLIFESPKFFSLFFIYSAIFL